MTTTARNHGARGHDQEPPFVGQCDERGPVVALRAAGFGAVVALAGSDSMRRTYAMRTRDRRRRETARVRAPRPPAAVAWSVTRGVLLALGLLVITVAFLGLVDVRLVLGDVAPWWYLGLIGLVMVLIALGSPWGGRIPDD